MPNVIDVNIGHLPLLDSFLAHLHTHIEDMELDWVIRTHSMYKELREMVRPLPVDNDVLDDMEYFD
ncbi:hypothetical protein NW762_001870 [Fusarium torreyae]|uniref:Uncharacterized protein n=1 Tax=Fusarium torreyae TaxID=1237075 RepID=A0A9W8SDC8_9HYPO|nr:hypothetical protein NW762_001870 [Fusarium torreyae]